MTELTYSQWNINLTSGSSTRMVFVIITITIWRIAVIFLWSSSPSSATTSSFLWFGKYYHILVTAYIPKLIARMGYWASWYSIIHRRLSFWPCRRVWLLRLYIRSWVGRWVHQWTALFTHLILFFIKCILYLQITSSTGRRSTTLTACTGCWSTLRSSPWSRYWSWSNILH